MTTTAAAPVPATSAPASRALPYVLVVLAVGQTVSSWISGEFAPEPLTSGVAESPLIPPGPWFAIWGLIITLSIAWSIVAIRPSVRDDAVRRRMAAGLVVTTAGFPAWLAVAAFGQSQPGTVPILVVMVLGLAWAMRVLVTSEAVRSWARWERLLAFGAVGTYLGWTSMATFLNVASVVQGAGASPDGAVGTAWQLGVLALAGGVAVGLVVLSRGSFAYGLTASYALVGIAISTATQGFPVLGVAAVVAVVLVLVATAGMAFRRLRRAPARPGPAR